MCSLGSTAPELRRDFVPHVKIFRRLGVSPGPLALNGPVMLNVCMCGRPAQSKLSIELRRNGCSRFGSCTGGSSTKATDTSWRPAVTGTRTRSRASIASLVSVGLSKSDARSSVPPIVARTAGTPGTATISPARSAMPPIAIAGATSGTTNRLTRGATSDSRPNDARTIGSVATWAASETPRFSVSQPGNRPPLRSASLLIFRSLR